MTDAQWDKIKDLLPGKESDPGRTALDNRLFVDALIDVLKTGIPWEDLPARYGKPNTVWKRFDRWCANGIWEQLAKGLSDPDLDEVHLDSSSVKSHPVSSTGRREPVEKRGSARPALPGTRSRGGLTTKLHTAVDRRGQLLQLILTPGQRGDAPQAQVLLEQIRPGTSWPTQQMTAMPFVSRSGS